MHQYISLTLLACNIHGRVMNAPVHILNITCLLQLWDSDLDAPLHITNFTCLPWPWKSNLNVPVVSLKSLDSHDHERVTRVHKYISVTTYVSHNCERVTWVHQFVSLTLLLYTCWAWLWAGPLGIWVGRLEALTTGMPEPRTRLLGCAIRDAARPLYCCLLRLLKHNTS